MLDANYIKHDLGKAIGLLRIGITSASAEYLSDIDVLMRTAHQVLETLNRNIEKQAERETLI